MAIRIPIVLKYLSGILLGLVLVSPVLLCRGEDMSRSSRYEDTLTAAVTVRAGGSQLFRGGSRPVMVPNRGIFFIRRLSRARIMRSGTGMIINDQGHILTAAHILEGLDGVEVVFSDGTKTRGKIVDIFREQDMAVLRADLPAWAERPVLGRSEELSAGDRVFLLNNPSGGESRVVSGIVRDTRKTIVFPHRESVFRDMVEVDLRVDEGSSGGPVVNEKGHVVGMAIAGHVFSRDSLYVIPVNRLREYCRKYFQNEM